MGYDFSFTVSLAPEPGTFALYALDAAVAFGERRA
jgi:hypothetical protein